MLERAVWNWPRQVWQEYDLARLKCSPFVSQHLAVRYRCNSVSVPPLADAWYQAKAGAMLEGNGRLYLSRCARGWM